MMSTVDSADRLYDIAIIGMAGRFPGAGDLAAFWRNLCDGVESIASFSDAELEAAGVSHELIGDPHYVKAGTVLEGVELFDAAFFGFNPREAELMDPQQRIFLEVAWETLETSGYDPQRYKGAIGVYAGSNMNTYLLFHLLANRDLIETVGSFQTRLGNDKDFLATRTSYKLNLQGPSINVQTACSTSLVAVHLACQSLLNRESDMALAGGVSVALPQKAGYLYREGMIFSPDGHCRAFDARAQGTVGSSGAGAVLLKRFADAVADGDSIYAVIRGSAINNDGAAKVGFSAPSVNGQLRVITEALAVAGVEPDTISYIETHGSGTPLGDQIEIAALNQAFQAATDRRGFCAIGALKTNIGHLDAAAGVAGLIKTVLALHHRQVPPSLNFEQPNPAIDFATSPFYVNTRLMDWVANGPRRAAVSSFGMGGTNAHLILEEAPELELSGSSRPWQLLLLSAKSSAALESMTDRLVDDLKAHPARNMADVAYTCQVGREAFSHRRALVCRDADDAAGALSRRDPQRVLTGLHEPGDRPVVFMFSGLGDHYPNMARGLYQAEATFRTHVDRCCALLEPYLGCDLRQVIYAGAGDDDAAAPAVQKVDLRRMLRQDSAPADSNARLLLQTALAQPALFVVEYALAQLWISWGIHPQALIGYSLGEYVAACLAGVLSLEDALALVARRAQLIQELPRGAMLAVPLSEEALALLLGEHLSLAAVNGPSLCVVAGPEAAVARLEQGLATQQIAVRRLQTEHAFHSSMLEPIAAPLLALIQTLKLSPPQIPYISNVTGTWITTAEATSPANWVKHTCQTVRFAQGLRVLEQEPRRIFVEVGPGQALSALVLQPASDSPDDRLALPSLRHAYEQRSDQAFMLQALGQLWMAGVPVDWSGFYAAERRRRAPLPTYPFERQRYWIDPPAPDTAARPTATAPATRAALDDWFYVLAWKQTVLPRPLAALDTPGSWLIFADAGGFGIQLAERLVRAGQRVITVTAGPRFGCCGDSAYTLHPERLADYEALLTATQASGQAPDQIIHCWSIGRSSVPGDDAGCLSTGDLGFSSLLLLVQALRGRNSTAGQRFWVVSDNVWEIESSDRCDPAKTMIAGLCKVISQEYPTIRCHHIDLTVPAPGSRQERWVVDQLLVEMRSPAPDVTIAYRGQQRWEQIFEHARFPAAAHEHPSQLRANGTYLVVEGLEGPGFVFAEYLAGATSRKLALIEPAALPAPTERQQWLAAHGSQDPMSRKLRNLQELEAGGADVLVIVADLTDGQQIRSALRRITTYFGALHGVLYTTGASGMDAFRAIAETDIEQGEQQIGPRKQALLALGRALQDYALDFCLVQSSLASVLGGLGLAAYTAASLFTDAFARRQTHDSDTPWISVNWDVWAMPEESEASAQPGMPRATSPITAAEGAEVLHRLLSARPITQVVVSTSDLHVRIEQWLAHAPGQELIVAQTSAAPAHTRPSIRTPYVAPGSETELIIVDVWQELLGIEQIGVHDSFFQLGGHSLLGTQVISRLRESFQVDLPLRAIFADPTVAGMALMIEALLIEELEAVAADELISSIG